jgi:hypothetical protein
MANKQRGGWSRATKRRALLFVLALAAFLAFGRRSATGGGEVLEERRETKNERRATLEENDGRAENDGLVADARGGDGSVAVAAAPATLVLIIGQPRGGDIAWKSFETHVYRRFNATVATVFPCAKKTAAASPKTRIERLATYDWCFDEPDDWSVHIDAVDCSRTIDPATSRPYNKSVANNWREFYCDATKEPSLALLGGLHDCILGNPRYACRDATSGGGGRNKKVKGGWNATRAAGGNRTHRTGCRREKPMGSGAIIASMRLMALEKIAALGLAEKFSQMILTRADYVYLKPPRHPVAMRDANVVHIPDGENWGGVTDRYGAGSTPAMLKYLRWGESYACDANRTAHDMSVSNGPEVSLDRYLRYVGMDVDACEATMFTVRRSSGEDPYSWRKGTRVAALARFGLLAKYTTEYKRALKNVGYDPNDLVSALDAFAALP